MPEALTYEAGSARLRWGDALLWFFAAACIAGITLLPLGGDKRDPYPWGFCGGAWVLAALAVLGGVATLRKESGATFDRVKGVVVLWSVFFGRRRERRIPLSTFNQLGVRTWVQTARGGREARYYSVDLRGPARKESLALYTPVNRPEGVRAIADYLNLPITVEDREPGRSPKSEL